MLMKTPPAVLDSKSPARTAERQRLITTALWFVIGALLWVLFAVATVKYGVVIPHVMN
jgi:hypothetical protein